MKQNSVFITQHSVLRWRGVMKNFLYPFLIIAVAFVGANAEAQQPKKIPRIGYAASGGDPNNPGRLVEAFRQGLRDLGYIEGKNIVVEYRYPGTNQDSGPSDV